MAEFKRTAQIIQFLSGAQKLRWNRDTLLCHVEFNDGSRDVLDVKSLREAISMTKYALLTSNVVFGASAGYLQAVYGRFYWPSFSYWIVPGTLDPNKG